MTNIRNASSVKLTCDNCGHTLPESRTPQPRTIPGVLDTQNCAQKPRSQHRQSRHQHRHRHRHAGPSDCRKGRYPVIPVYSPHWPSPGTGTGIRARGAGDGVAAPSLIPPWHHWRWRIECEALRPCVFVRASHCLPVSAVQGCRHP